MWLAARRWLALGDKIGTRSWRLRVSLFLTKSECLCSVHQPSLPTTSSLLSMLVLATDSSLLI